MKPKPCEWSVTFRVNVDYAHKTAEKEKRYMDIMISNYDMVKICGHIEGKTEPVELHYRHYQNAVKLADALFRISYTYDPIEKLMKVLDEIRDIYYKLRSGSGSRHIEECSLKEEELMAIVSKICGKRKEIADHPPIVYPIGTMVKILKVDQKLVAPYQKAISEKKIDPEGDDFYAKRIRALTAVIGQILPIDGHIIDTHSHYVMFQGDSIVLRPEDIEPVGGERVVI